MKRNEITPVNVLCWLRGIVTWERSSSVPRSKQLRAKCDSCTVVVDM